jgi:hypothetical protein
VLALALLAWAPAGLAEVVFSHLADNDPMAGEGWGVTPGDTGSGVARGPVTGDGDRDAWFVDDGSTGSGTRYRYEKAPTAVDVARAQGAGWTLRVVLRVAGPAPDPVDASIIAEYSDATRRYGLLLGKEADGDAIVSVLGAGASYTAQGTGEVYHEYLLYLNPNTGLASVQVDGVERITGYSGVAASGVGARVNFGSGDSAGRGRGHYGLVEWGVSEDSDGDGIPDPADSCPYYPNYPNVDTGGVGAGSGPDGIGDPCQCGDLTADGRVDPDDLARYRAFLADPEGAPLTGPDLLRCALAGETSACDIRSVVLMARALALETGVLSQTCAAATGFGQSCGDGVCVEGCQQAPRGCPVDCGRCPLGLACVDDADCASGYCADGLCGARPLGPAVTPYCGDGVCSAEETCSRLGASACFDDCGPCPTASLAPCNTDADCDAGGVCAFEKRCEEGSPAGRIKCTEDAQCGAGFACRSTSTRGLLGGLCSDLATTCTMSLLDPFTGPQQSNCADGDLCDIYKMCQPPPAAPPPPCHEGPQGTCKPGEYCEVDADCQAGLACRTFTLPYIPGATVFVPFNRQCVPPLDNGYPCNVDAHCTSGFCLGECPLGLCQGFCADPLPLPPGSFCSRDEECESGLCSAGTCARVDHLRRRCLLAAPARLGLRRPGDAGHRGRRAVRRFRPAPALDLRGRLR